MRRSRPSTDVRGDEDGSAALEFIVAGCVLLVPLVYLVVALGAVQSHALGVQALARQLARVVATAPADRAGAALIDATQATIADQYGLDAADLDVEVSCAAPGACPQPGTLLTVTVRSAASLPLVPPVLGLDSIAEIPVEARAVQRVARLWDAS